MHKNWNFDHSYFTLGEQYYSEQQPVPVAKPELLVFNEALASSLGIPYDTYSKDELAAIGSGNGFPFNAKPMAQAYAGHQFGHFTMLGDGRALLMGELITPEKKRMDIQWKGSGRTAFSRRGDGRATLSAMLREYLISEALHNLNIPTSRSLSVTATGENVYREIPQPGAVLIRVASGHIRVGTFEYVYRYLEDADLKKFTDYVIGRHYPHLQEEEKKYELFLKEVMHRQIQLIVDWMRVGFIHGVMNTDNMNIAGETFDYGPCAFMNVYDPKTVFSSIDTQGRYAFSNQPSIARWNLAVLAGSLLPLLDSQQDKAVQKAQEIMDQFNPLFTETYYTMMGNKIGIVDLQKEEYSFVQRLLDWMFVNKMDYTETFVQLTYKTTEDKKFQDEKFLQWKSDWENRLKNQDTEITKSLMQKNNPVIIPRNHKVEEVLAQASDEGNLGGFLEMVEDMKNAYRFDRTLLEKYAAPEEENPMYRTYCNT